MSRKMYEHLVRRARTAAVSIFLQSQMMFPVDHPGSYRMHTAIDLQPEEQDQMAEMGMFGQRVPSRGIMLLGACSVQLLLLRGSVLEGFQIRGEGYSRKGMPGAGQKTTMSAATSTCMYGKYMWTGACRRQRNFATDAFT